MSEILHLEDRIYILSTSAVIDTRRVVLKDGLTFGVFDRRGDIQPFGFSDQGLYNHDTRFVSRWELLLAGKRPLLLSSVVANGNSVLVVDLTNPDIEMPDGTQVRHGSLHILRIKFICDDVCYDQLSFSNFTPQPLAFNVLVKTACDFRDIFEVRGIKREKRGKLLSALRKEGQLTSRYLGLDGIKRGLQICSWPPADINETSELRFPIEIEAHSSKSISLSCACNVQSYARRHMNLDQAYGRLLKSFKRTPGVECKISSKNPDLDAWLNQSSNDLKMLTTEVDEREYPYAGIPWFSAPFGRDGILTAYLSLCFRPQLAKGVLYFLAKHQARNVRQDREAEPGKILHELRNGEMANLGEVPFGCYYGSVDSTPLFLMLAAAYFRCTGDRQLIESIWQHIEAALLWIDQYADKDNDGFYEYSTNSESGLVNQGWKDSGDSVFHADGELAKGLIALCEVQAYVYAAKHEIAGLADRIGQFELAASLRRDVMSLKRRFDTAFWSEEIDCYALALDGKKKACKVRTSNAGHALFAEIAEPERAAILARNLFEEDFFSGWGIRTVSSRERNYNPLSYHNGSVWPHDNAMIAHGLARYNFKDETARIFTAMMSVARSIGTYRLPELFCGFPKRSDQSLTLHPVACSPQAWAAASVLALLQSSLGISVDGQEKHLTINRPVLPSFIDEVDISGLQVGESSIDLSFKRLGGDVGTHVSRRQGKVDLTILK